MARPARPEQSNSARSSRQFSRFYHSINPDRVFGTHREGKAERWHPAGEHEFLRLRLAHALCQELSGRSLRYYALFLASRSLNERRSITIRWWWAADLLFAVAYRHFEVNSSSFDVDYLGRRAHLVAYRRGGEVSYIHCSADRAFTCVQKRSNGIERGIFHDRRIITGVASTCGSMASLNWLARCSGCTCNIDPSTGSQRTCCIHSS